MGNYLVTKNRIDVYPAYSLHDARRGMNFRLAPTVGNLGFSFTVDGEEILLAPKSLSTCVEKNAVGWGIPLLAPFANRIDGDAYYFQGTKYLINDSLRNLGRCALTNYPIHGLLACEARWKVVSTAASESTGAVVTSRLDFSQYPDLMAQFPFAHTIEVEYRLRKGALECTTRVRNTGAAPMPVHLGYHPYFVPDGPRADWTLHIAAKSHWIVRENLIPTGKKEPTDAFLPRATRSIALGGTFIDDGFTDLRRDADSNARFWVAGQRRKIEVVFGSGYSTAIIYAPLHADLICIEPQTGPTNAFNLAHAGKFKNLVILESGKTFRATFWILPTLL